MTRAISPRALAMGCVSDLRRARKIYGSGSDEAKVAEKVLAKANRVMRPKPKAKAKPSD